jgi:hypothetical protein
MTYDTDAALGLDSRSYETRAEGGGEEQDDSIAEVRTAVEDFTATAEQRFVLIDTTLSELSQRLERTETTLRRPGAGTEDHGEDARAVEHRAFVHFIRRGTERLRVDEVRSLRVSDDTAGGYLAPEPCRCSKKLSCPCGGSPPAPRAGHTRRGMVPGRDEGRTKEQAHLSLGEKRFASSGPP